MGVMTDVRSVLAIGAHPDDIEIGCLGFLLKLGPGARTHLYFASLGALGDPTSGPERQAESEAACECLRPASLTFRRKAGILPTDHVEIMADIARLVSDHDPDLVLVGSPHDTHQEHAYVYQAAISAMRRSRASLAAYCGNSTTLDFRPTIFVDIAAVVEAKLQALARHRSQGGKIYMTREFFDTFHGHPYAAVNGVRCCERFEPVRLFW
jgi:LmbE family N-acetylglucosaminyl deacetylase